MKLHNDMKSAALDLINDYHAHANEGQSFASFTNVTRHQARDIITAARGSKARGVQHYANLAATARCKKMSHTQK